MKSVTLVDVSLRDGLQNEKTFLSIEEKKSLVGLILDTGIRRLELGAFVREDKVPQMAGTEELLRIFKSARDQGKFKRKALGSVLVPNAKGMEKALITKQRNFFEEVAVFGSCTEKFSQANLNCSIRESFERFAEVLKIAKKNHMRVRGYLSTCFGCPYEGEVDPKVPKKLARKLLDMGCYEVSLGDTIGVATPKDVQKVLKPILRLHPARFFAGHFHDTRGTALANIYESYLLGLRTFDASVGGLGGCPYAPGAAGNVAMEDVVYFFEKMKISTGVSLAKVVAVNQILQKWVGRELPSKSAQAFLASKPR